MSHKKILDIDYDAEIMSYFVDCPIDVKSKIIDFFTNVENMEKQTTLIKVSGMRLFTNYQFFNKSHSVNMISISTYGIKYLNEYCDGCTESEITMFLRKLFRRTCKDQRTLTALLRVAPVMAGHYKGYRMSSYELSNSNPKCICILYPIEKVMLKGVSSILTLLQRDHKEKIFKGTLGA